MSKHPQLILSVCADVKTKTAKKVKLSPPASSPEDTPADKLAEGAHTQLLSILLHCLHATGYTGGKIDPKLLLVLAMVPLARLAWFKQIIAQHKSNASCVCCNMAYVPIKTHCTEARGSHHDQSAPRAACHQIPCLSFSPGGLTQLLSYLL